jgi:surfeit locus 1 family protein
MTNSWEPQIEPRAVRPAAKGFPVGLTIASAVAIVILIGLGAWQLQRLKWKETLLAGIAHAEAAAPVRLEPVLDAMAQGKAEDFTRVTVTCPGLATAPVIELYSLRGGEIGSRLISACPVEGAAYRTVLIDRGFVPDVVAARPPVDPDNAEPIVVTGVLRKSERGNFTTPAATAARWYLHDTERMGRALHAAQPVAPLFLMAETSTAPGFKDLQAAPFPIDIPNRHLEYALTWFGLAGALAGVYGAAVFKRMRG